LFKMAMTQTQKLRFHKRLGPGKESTWPVPPSRAGAVKSDVSPVAAAMPVVFR